LHANRKKSAPRLVFAALAILLAFPATAQADDELERLFRRDVLVIVANAWACHRFDIYLAMDDQQRQRGLMFVRQLPATTGMLFVYDDAHMVSMWMKNTYIPLDMVFARADGSVASVARDAEPLSLRSIASTEPVTFVLELNAGTTRRLSIDRGSRLVWSPASDAGQ
jgi:uncharacterized protein